MGDAFRDGFEDGMAGLREQAVWLDGLRAEWYWPPRRGDSLRRLLLRLADALERLAGLGR